MHEFIHSPASLLASFLSRRIDTPMLVLVTGKSGSGKTTWCQEMIHQASLAGLSPWGFVSPGVFENGHRIAIDLQDVQTGERKRLAVRCKDHTLGEPVGRRASGWLFDVTVIEWANQVLNQPKNADLLIIDEVGPLEFMENRGLTGALQRIDEQNYRLACVTVRPLLMSTALERWPWGMPLDLAEGRAS